MGSAAHPTWKHVHASPPAAQSRHAQDVGADQDRRRSPDRSTPTVWLGSTGVRIGLDVSQQQLEWPEIGRRARLADDLGFDGIWLFDHFKTMYGESGGPCFEAWTSLAALAAITERARLGILITGMTYRHPSVLASEAVTVDHVSGGRLELSLGAAWFEEEHRELGIEFPPTGERVSRFEEYVQVVHLLLTEDDVSFDGRWHRLDRATYRPRPVQQPHPPIWIGA
ncbi:MAG: LLM class flavin-dependent oxidoreductase, partial [Actinobacteria bacterium]